MNFRLPSGLAWLGLSMLSQGFDVALIRSTTPAEKGEIEFLCAPDFVLRVQFIFERRMMVCLCKPGAVSDDCAP